MIVAIHQPNFMPWLPFFKKMALCDRFVILGHCQFGKHNYQNRFWQGGWHTMSVQHGLRPIHEKRYCRPEQDWQGIKKSLPDFRSTLDIFNNDIGASLLETNTLIIKRIVSIMGMGAEILKDYPTDLTSTERLVDLCLHYGATTYLSGSGSSRYLDRSLFEVSGIEVVFQEVVEEDKCSIVEHLQLHS